jgi:hypothetical protein
MSDTIQTAISNNIATIESESPVVDTDTSTEVETTSEASTRLGRSYRRWLLASFSSLLLTGWNPSQVGLSRLVLYEM